jgi:hypothetical protein
VVGKVDSKIELAGMGRCPHRSSIPLFHHSIIPEVVPYQGNFTPKNAILSPKSASFFKY